MGSEMCIRDSYKIVWDDIVEQMGLEVCDFTLSENIVQLKYCTVTGLLASSSCTSTRSGYYKTSSKPETCDCYHYTGEEDGDTEYGKRAGLLPFFATSKEPRYDQKK